MIFVGTMCNRYSDSSVGLGNLTTLNNLLAIHTSKDATDIFNQLLWINDPGAPTTIPPGEDVIKTSSKKEYTQSAKSNFQNYLSRKITSETDLAYQERDCYQVFALGVLGEPIGTSNAWVLGKKKTYDGGSIFQNGPQFGWWNPGYVYELGLHGAGFDVVGNTPLATRTFFSATTRILPGEVQPVLGPL